MRDRQGNLDWDETKFHVQYRTGALSTWEDICSMDEHFTSLLSPGGWKCVDTSWQFGIRVLTFKKALPNGEA